jgi:hypothetical protein
MADGLFLYKTDVGFVVMDEDKSILKESKTSKTCERFISKMLQSRRLAENKSFVI